jgi:hypothetical protein
VLLVESNGKHADSQHSVSISVTEPPQSIVTNRIQGQSLIGKIHECLNANMQHSVPNTKRIKPEVIGKNYLLKNKGLQDQPEKQIFPCAPINLELGPLPGLDMGNKTGNSNKSPRTPMTLT